MTSGTDEALTYVTPTTVDSVQQELTLQAPQEVGSSITIARRGKAPPIDTFTGENCDVLREDWLPTFERAAHWNSWSEDEKLLQVAGYLRRKALQEWNLLSGTQKSSFTVGTEEMQNRLDPGSKALAAQDFRHSPKPQGIGIRFYPQIGASLSKGIWQRTDVNRNSRHPATWTTARGLE